MLLGQIERDALDLALALGPERVTVPIDRMASIAREHWSVLTPAQAETGVAAATPRHAADARARLEMAELAPETEPAASPPPGEAPGADGYFRKSVFVPSKSGPPER